MAEVPDVFDAATCALVLAVSEAQEQTAGVVARDDGELAGVDRTVRRVRQCALPRVAETEDVYQQVAALTERCNRQWFRFALDGVHEELVVVDYGPGDFYNWHLDMGPAAPVRKLSMSILLSPPSEYEGGALTFPGRTVDAVPQGGAVVFPSFLLHGVQPVRRGRRRALLAWVGGPRFR